MDENFEDNGHTLQGPHRDLFRAGDLPPGFEPLRLGLPDGGRLDLHRPEMVVGRHSGADIRLAYPDISRRHCRLSFHDGCWHAIDLSSLNGVFLNGDRIVEAVLHEGDQLRVGSIIFAVAGSNCVRPHPHHEVLKSIAEVLPERRHAG